VNYTYDHISPGQTLGVVSENLPLGYEGIGVFSLYSVTYAKTPRRVRPSTFVKHHASWVILSQSQESWGVNVAGYPESWEVNLESSLLSTGYKIIKVWPTATVLHASSSIVGHS
jgi:hypothetical protein